MTENIEQTKGVAETALRPGVAEHVRVVRTTGDTFAVISKRRDALVGTVRKRNGCWEAIIDNERLSAYATDDPGPIVGAFDEAVWDLVMEDHLIIAGAPRKNVRVVPQW